MTNSSTSSPQRSAAGVSLRKTNKPLMEKRRRARINDSLSQLKSLVIQSSKKDSSQFNKLEKADILELTVKHLRSLQSRDQQQQMAQAANTDSAGKYCAGFIECANEVIRFLKQSQGFSDDVKARVVNHLASCLQFTTQSYAKTSPPQLSTTATATPVLTAQTGVLGNAQQAASAQLTNGQIIHIVNAPLQTAKPLSMSATNGQLTSAPVSNVIPAMISKSPASSIEPTKVPLSPPQQQQYHPHQHRQQQDQPSISLMAINPSSSAPTSVASSSLQQEKSFTKFSQPLHIQIPASVSPFVIKADSRLPQAGKRMDDNIIQHHQHNAKLTHQTTSISPAETTPINMSTPPSPHHTDLPVKTRHVHFYPSDLHLTNEYLPRHRTYSMTSSSSESEMSPLNLSQSPISTSSSASYDYSKDISCPARSQHREGYLPVSYKLEKVSPPSGYSPYDQHHHRDLQDNMDLSQSSFTSVIVNARRSLDMTQSKYMAMEMEDERLCPRQHGTPSPASSMGEERLWRPW